MVVIGGGIAGCAAALAAARRGAEVALLTKLLDPEEANTRYAQGGIVYTGPDDSPDLLVEDIVESGAGSRAAAELLSREGPPLVRGLLIEALQVPFDRDADGFEGLHLTLEAAHSAPRILHHHDTTGREIQRALTHAVRNEERVTLLPGTEALELILSGGRCAGVHAARDGEILTLLGRGVVLATGGLGALYEHTTNPSAASGDGFALALRAGARLRDLHYVQFHPTALYSPNGERFLVSEAVRGEGGVLEDPDGEQFVDHPLGSLAPRDVVARETWSMMKRTGSPCAYLNITDRSAEWLEERFPAIYSRCSSSEGIDMSRQPIPVVPAAHYTCGGVETNLSGRTSLRGLWAAGEVANNGLHGSNRLASTSLLEGLVFGWRAGEDAAHSPAPVLDRPPANPPVAIPEDGPEKAWRRMRHALWNTAGLVRTAEGLGEGIAEIGDLKKEYRGTTLDRALTVAQTLLEGALHDARSRGCHYRLDAQDEVAFADLPG